jgi:hypothetical protein
MVRSMTIAVLSAAVVGSVGGTVLALLRPADDAVEIAARPASTPHAPAAPVSAPALVPDRGAALVSQIRTVLARFAAWSRDHLGASCPDLATLGVTAIDPWGHALVLTCTDQPADQVIGAVSVGPDGRPGTDDDVASWTLGPSVTSLVRGARWKPATTVAAQPPARPGSGRRRDPRARLVDAPATSPTAPPPPSRSVARPPTSATPPPPLAAGSDGIPDKR